MYNSVLIALSFIYIKCYADNHYIIYLSIVQYGVQAGSCVFKAASSKVEFTNINCTSWDTDFSNFEYCYLKSVNRSYKYLSLKVNLYKVPISDIKVNFSTLKKLNGYKPFLYNVTVDACKFLKKPKSNPVFLYIHNIFSSFSNMNHTCPYNDDLVVEKLSTQFVNNHVTAVLPVPEGDYALQTSWFANNVLRATVSVFGSIS